MSVPPLSERTGLPPAETPVGGNPESAPEELELNAILGAGTALSGRFSFAGRVRVEGQVEGDLLGGELLVVAGAARVKGTISAERVLVLNGEVNANITASISIELRVPAVVTGDLRAPEIFWSEACRSAAIAPWAQPSTEA